MAPSPMRPASETSSPSCSTADIPVVAPAVPNRSLNGDAAYVGAVLATVPGPVVLVGHSYGCAVATVAGTADNVASLVYLAASSRRRARASASSPAASPSRTSAARWCRRLSPVAWTSPSRSTSSRRSSRPTSTRPTTRILAVSQRPLSAAAFEERRGRRLAHEAGLGSRRDLGPHHQPGRPAVRLPASQRRLPRGRVLAPGDARRSPLSPSELIVKAVVSRRRLTRHPTATVNRRSPNMSYLRPPSLSRAGGARPPHRAGRSPAHRRPERRAQRHAAAPNLRASNAHPPRAKPTIVLVHGAWADSSGWARGDRGAAGQGLRHDRARQPAARPDRRTRRTSAASWTPSPDRSSWSGHSYGGAVISGAAAGAANVKALVYVAAFVPDEGEPVGLLTQLNPGSLVTENALVVRPTRCRGGTGVDLYLRPGIFRKAFAADLPRQTTTADVGHPATARLGGVRRAGRSRGLAHRSRPGTCWPPRTTRSRRRLRPSWPSAPAPRSTRVTSSHVAMQSRPREATTELILAAVARRRLTASRRPRRPHARPRLPSSVPRRRAPPRPGSPDRRPCSSCSRWPWGRSPSAPASSAATGSSSCSPPTSTSRCR